MKRVRTSLLPPPLRTQYTNMETTKTKKVIKHKHYFICKGTKGGETNCGKIFYNDDDNVCVYCGSKNTKAIYDIKFKRF